MQIFWSLQSSIIYDQYFSGISSVSIQVLSRQCVLMFRVTPFLCRVKRGFLTLSVRDLTPPGGASFITQVCYQLVTQTGVVNQSECVLGCVRKTFFRNFPAIREIPIPLRPNSWPPKILPLPIISSFTENIIFQQPKFFEVIPVPNQMIIRLIAGKLPKKVFLTPPNVCHLSPTLIHVTVWNM